MLVAAPNVRVDTNNTHALASEPEPYNVILMIGDGMGPSQIELGRLVEYGPSGNLTMQDAPLTISVTTFSADNSITDSAAAATAIATGWKTNNGMVSVLPNGTILDTILENAQLHGKATGLVVTSEIQHATPACFATHVSSRSNYVEITRQLVEEAEVDVLLGGGLNYFSPAQLQYMENQNYTIVQNRTGLLDVQNGTVLGLFAGSHMDYEEVRNYSQTPSLAEMTNKTLSILSNDPDGFFLMVEGSRIDHAAHANDPIGVALEMVAFDNAVEVALEYVQSHEHTILIVTADHETGGLAVISHNLSDELPTDGMSEEEKRSLRIERTQNVSVTWSTGYHTSTNVSLFCFGPLFSGLSNGSIIDNTDIFNEISQYYAEEPADSPPQPPKPTSTTTNRNTTTTTNNDTTTVVTTSTESTSSTTIETSTDSSTSSTTNETSSSDSSFLPSPFYFNPLFLGLVTGSAAVIIVILVRWKQLNS
ncbi:MAG: alkaline phosphatase [Candidatus Thorarchaeota archaeon]